MSLAERRTENDVGESNRSAAQGMDHLRRVVARRIRGASGEQHGPRRATQLIYFVPAIVIRVISGGASKRIGGPQVPAPRLTYSRLPSVSSVRPAPTR